MAKEGRQKGGLTVLSSVSTCFISPVLSGGACIALIDVAAPLGASSAFRKGERENI